MAQYSFADYSAHSNATTTPNTENRARVSYFALKNDGDYAVVRFIYDSPEQFEISTIHAVDIDGRSRRVDCLRGPKDSVHSCPLCEAGVRAISKFYVKLIEYTTDPQTGMIIANPRIWERPASFANDLAKKCQIYNGLSQHTFIITRHGVKGSQGTTYSVDFAPAEVYKPDLYVRDFSAFDSYKLSSYVVLNKSYDELKALAGNNTVIEPESAASVPAATYSQNGQTFNQTPSTAPSFSNHTIPVQPSFTPSTAPQSSAEAPKLGTRRYF